MSSSSQFDIKDSSASGAQDQPSYAAAVGAKISEITDGSTMTALGDKFNSTVQATKDLAHVAKEQIMKGVGQVGGAMGFSNVSDTTSTTSTSLPESSASGLFIEDIKLHRRRSQSDAANSGSAAAVSDFVPPATIRPAVSNRFDEITPGFDGSIAPLLVAASDDSDATTSGGTVQNLKDKVAGLAGQIGAAVGLASDASSEITVSEAPASGLFIEDIKLHRRRAKEVDASKPSDFSSSASAFDTSSLKSSLPSAGLDMNTVKSTLSSLPDQISSKTSNLAALAKDKLSDMSDSFGSLDTTSTTTSANPTTYGTFDDRSKVSDSSFTASSGLDNIKSSFSSLSDKIGAKASEASRAVSDFAKDNFAPSSTSSDIGDSSKLGTSTGLGSSNFGSTGLSSSSDAVGAGNFGMDLTRSSIAQ